MATVTVIPVPIFEVIITHLDVTGDEVKLEAKPSEYSYQWFFKDGSQSFQNPVIYAPQAKGGIDTVLVISVESQKGCSDTLKIKIVIREEELFYVLNTFTPDGDEVNNTFKPIFTAGFDPLDFNFTIFNRWGEVLFESNDPKLAWDGTYKGQLVEEGSYTWKIRHKKLYSTDIHEITGHVMLLK